MCCRYYIDEDAPEFQKIIRQMNSSPLLARWQESAPIVTRGEVRPTDVVPVIAPDRRGGRAVFPMKWGYTARSLLINARTETAAEKPTFMEDWRRHRCAVPSSWYFEWEHLLGPDGKKRTGRKFAIRPENVTLTWLCGLYRIENGLPRFVVLTREPGDNIRFIHNRMPLILPKEQTDEWIRPDTDPERLLSFAETDMEYICQSTNCI